MKFLREPLLHFLVAGALMFGSYAWLGDRTPETQGVQPVRVNSGKVEWLRKTFSSQWLRDPDAEELNGLIVDLVTEELMAREAREMGLDQDDTIVRRRLAQKLKFLVEDTASMAEPPEAELKKYYGEHAGDFQVLGTVSFRQVYFNPENRKDPVADATAMLGTLNADSGDAVEAGDRFVLGSDFEKLDQVAASGMFGDDFTSQIFSASLGMWRGPFKSGYGYHLINVTERLEAKARPFVLAKEAVLLEWLREQKAKVSRDYIGLLSEKYGVVYDDAVTKMLSLKPNVDVALQ